MKYLIGLSKRLSPETIWRQHFVLDWHVVMLLQLNKITSMDVRCGMQFAVTKGHGNNYFEISSEASWKFSRIFLEASLQNVANLLRCWSCVRKTGFTATPANCFG